MEGSVTGAFIKVQIKQKPPEDWTIYVKAHTVRYWLSLGAPVVFFCSEPITGKVRWLDVRRYALKHQMHWTLENVPDRKNLRFSFDDADDLSEDNDLLLNLAEDYQRALIPSLRAEANTRRQYDLSFMLVHRWRCDLNAMIESIKVNETADVVVRDLPFLLGLRVAFESQADSKALISKYVDDYADCITPAINDRVAGRMTDFFVEGDAQATKHYRMRFGTLRMMKYNAHCEHENSNCREITNIRFSEDSYPFVYQFLCVPHARERLTRETESLIKHYGAPEQWDFRHIFGIRTTGVFFKTLCPRCGQPGYAFGLDGEGTLNTDEDCIDHRIRDILAEFLRQRPAIAAKFGTVKPRSSSSPSQGCPGCDCEWNWFFVCEEMLNYIHQIDRDEFDGSDLIRAFCEDMTLYY